MLATRIINQVTNTTRKSHKLIQIHTSRLKKEKLNKTYFDGEIGRQGPNDGVVKCGALSGGSSASFEEGGSQPHGPVDHIVLVGIARPRLEKAVE